MPVKTALKDLAMTACRALRPRPPTVGLVLLYHSVGSEWGVSREDFLWQLDVMADRFEIVTLRDLPSRLGAGSRPVASITFDDGYRDNVDLAAPAVEAAGARATFFIATGFIGGRLPNATGSWPAMDTADIRALHAAGHEIGAHTVSHPKLSRLDGAQAAREIRDSKAALEDLTGGPVVSFAYPKGDYDASVRTLVAEAGFRVACTIREGHLPPVPDWFAIPRLSVLPTTTRRQFLARLSMGFELYERMLGR